MMASPPFRVLGGANSSYLFPSVVGPPPPAPEPYKVARSSPSSGRAHRKSSFVIIAETRAATPTSASPSSPSLATGRISPFRGRGFKGPPPHAQSRPQTPVGRSDKERGGRGKRASVSQRNSPDRSLLPRPARPRSISLTNGKDRRPASKDRSIVTTPNRGSGASLKAPGLSPIQGTPTRPSERRTARVLAGNKPPPSPSPSPNAKSNGNSSLLPSKSVSDSGRTGSGERSPARSKAQGYRPTPSPSKIPLTRGLTANKSGIASSQSLRHLAASRSTKPTRKAAPSKRLNDETAEEKEKKKKEATNEGARGFEVDSPSLSHLPENENGPTETTLALPKEEAKSGDGDDDDLGLVDLLRQLSGGVGGNTSSVVNTTTTTAVRPLSIDTTTILIESDTNDKHSADEQKRSISQKKNEQTTETNSSREDGGDSTTTTTTTTTTTSNKINGKVESAGETSSGGAAANATLERAKGAAPVAGKTTNGANDGMTFGKGSNGGKGQRVVVDDRNDRASEAIERNGTSSYNGSQILATSKFGDSTRRVGDAIERVAASVDVDPTGRSDKLEDERSQRNIVSTDQRIRTDRSTNESNVNKSSTTQTRSASSSMKKVSGTATVSRENGGTTTIQSLGSNASVKSSTGISANSVASVRSTDIGTSVNTIRGGGGDRGLSSARVKKGTHLVKRTQEIETLSGNLTHLEQNGEPTVLTPGRGEARVTEQRSYWNKFSGRYRECCSSMRCLACRRGPKGGRPWPGGAKTTTTTAAAATAPTVEASNDGAERPVGCWPRLKAACKRSRWKQSGGCCVAGKGRRIAPAEGPTACCPPERRCGGALCRRLFARCRCKRHEATRARNIRGAKQSLTSVAAVPPLSEEPKARIPEVLVEHNSLMRGAIPCLPVPLAWFCLVWNVLIPGTGTFWSGLFDLCTGQPRFSSVAGPKARLGALIVNLVVGVGQLFTVLFCLVGWGWSIWWGITMVRLAKKYKRFRDSEAANGDPEARVGEAGAAALPRPGVPSQALRGVERAR